MRAKYCGECPFCGKDGCLVDDKGGTCSYQQKYQGIIAKVWRACVYRIKRPFTGLGLRILNFLVQRVFGVSGDCPWPVNYTSRCTGRIVIGKNVWKSFAASGGCYIQGINGVVIGDDTIFAPGVKIISANHVPGHTTEWVKCNPIEIGKHVWLGANVTVLPGVKIGDYSIIGANAVVSSDIPSNAIAVGVPAKVIRMTTPSSDVEK